jgi:hypothetical protein
MIPRRNVFLSWAAAAAAVLFSGSAQAAPLLIVTVRDAGTGKVLAGALERLGATTKAVDQKHRSTIVPASEVEELAEKYAAELIIVVTPHPREATLAQIKVTSATGQTLRTFEVAKADLRTTRRAGRAAQSIKFSIEAFRDSQGRQEATHARIQVPMLYPGVSVPDDAPYVEGH